MNQVLDFFLLVGMQIYTQNLPVYNSGQHIYPTGLLLTFYLFKI